jgi:hypothetical protein
MDPKLKGTLNIPDYSFGCFPMAFMRELHIPRNKANNKGNVGMGMGKIQKDTNKSMVQSSFYFKGSTCEGKLDSILK